MRALLATLLLFLAAAGPLQAADPVAVPVPVRSGLHEGYGRIVFDWTREVGYQARLDGARLVIDFDEAAAFEGRLMRDGLEGYAAAPQASADGRSLTLPLSGSRSEEQTTEVQSPM